MDVADGGLASDYWKKYYTPGEVEEIIANTTTTQIVSGEYPISVRRYERSTTAPTVIVGHPMVPYGLMMARLHLPFYRAGFNVAQWDLPGWGQSGGPRAGCPIDDVIAGWRDMLDYAHQRYGGPLYVLAIAEDSVTAYYALANDPRVRAMSLHALHEYGDPDGLHWIGPHWLIRLSAVITTIAARLFPAFGMPARRAFPWEAIFSGAGDEWLLRLFERDPLRVRQYKLPLVASLARRCPPPVRFEDCATPIQMIVSERSSIWPLTMHLRAYNRLGGPKTWITLRDMDQWSFGRAFQEMYASRVIAWFRACGANLPPAGVRAMPPEPRRRTR